MNEFRQLAARIDQQMQQLSVEGVSEAPTVIHRMMGHVPALHRIWVGTSDQQLMALSREFPGFYRYARLSPSPSPSPSLAGIVEGSPKRGLEIGPVWGDQTRPTKAADPRDRHQPGWL